jgi:hypothetical protein
VKPWYKSKTMWLNIATVGGAVVGGVVGLIPTLQPLIDPTTYSVTMFIVGLANIVLRSITDTAIGNGDANQD